MPNMDLRHLSCFVAVAEELHFARAAERLHIDQFPLSRTIKELEDHLSTVLFVRTTCSIRLTHAGKLFFEHVPRVFFALKQTPDSLNAAVVGYNSQLSVAMSDITTAAQLSTLLTLCCQEGLEIALNIDEIPLALQIKGLLEDLYDVIFSQSSNVGDGIVAVPAWSEPLHVAIPKNHPIQIFKHILLTELLCYPLIMADPQLCEGHYQQVERAIHTADKKPLIAHHVKSLDLMIAMVAAGFGLGLVGADHLAIRRAPGIMERPLLQQATRTIWLLYRDVKPSESLTRFIKRAPNLGIKQRKLSHYSTATLGEVI